ncbi:hypothetical protein [Erysipelothrix anatis]|uniref:hypothetical protein n=1 Tax=Erysipelothrix anatis TaxID=2683713 RepID=UPI00135C9B34|nr:hypothetical protein [Erysipelothrix anatis]
MVIIDVFGKIEKISISDKLKLYVSNVPNDWKESLIEDMLKEIRQQKVDIEDNLRRYGNAYQTEFSISYLKKIIKAHDIDYSDYNLNSIENCIQCLIDSMICLFLDYEYSDMPFFDWTTNCFDGRFCEEDYAEKIMDFSNFVNHDIKNGFNMNCIYTSNMNPREHTRILLNLTFRVDSEFKNWKSTDEYINELKEMGTRIDNILNSENDYYKLDYIMNGLFKDNNYNQNHYLKTFTLLELVLLRPNQDISEIDQLLIPYLDNEYGLVSSDVARLLRQMRNKIGHGDFKGFNEKAEKFAQKYMKNFWFDYTEYSRLNWVLLHTCCLLDDLLRTALFHQLKNSK